MTKNKKTLFNVIDDITWKKTPITKYSDEDKKSILNAAKALTGGEEKK